jgi:Holliday junction resolvasome RuvABC endonuclease subunit
MKRVLGFDVSSSTIGYSVLEIKDDKIDFVLCNYVKPPKKGSIIDRMVETRNTISSIIEQVQPDYIGIEDIIQFMKGKSTAKTIIMLTTFNRMVGLIAYDYLKCVPELFSVMSIRHGLKLNKILPKKEQIPELVAQRLGITFPYLYDKKGKIKMESYDMADGVAVALYYALILTGQAKRKGKKK